VAVVVDERLRGDERKHRSGGVRGDFGGHAVHARAPLFRDVIQVIAAYERDDVSLLLNKEKETHRESRESHQGTRRAIALAPNHSE
jgi:hypothetical protein